MNMAFLRFFTAVSCLVFSCAFLSATSSKSAKKHALQATKAIRKLPKTVALSKSEILKMALFIEQKLPRELKRHKTYFSRKNTRLARSIQVDPKNGKVYIHLREHGTRRIGQGTNKLVTNTIVYDRKKPELVAHAENAVVMHNEIQAIKDLAGKSGMYKVYSILERKKTKQVTFISKLYDTNLQSFLLKKGKKISLRQKIRLASDIIRGVDSMHRRKYAHRDLSLKNYFVKRIGKSYRAVVGDLGRAIKNGIGEDRGAQGGYGVNAPEGYSCHKLKGDDYLATDVYALGCVFWRILYNKKPVWYDEGIMKNHSIPVEMRQARLIQLLNAYINAEKKKKSSSVHGKFKSVILEMIAPYPQNRPNASQVRKRLKYIWEKVK